MPSPYATDPLIIPTLCTCPKCGTIHTVMMHWSGNGIPKKFCPKCDYLKKYYTPHPTLHHSGDLNE